MALPPHSNLIVIRMTDKVMIMPASGGIENQKPVSHVWEGLEEFGLLVAKTK